MIKNIGINGFGRIGKCVFLQALTHPEMNICAINAVNLKIEDIEDYLFYDSCHKYDLSNFTFKILDNNVFQIGKHKVKLFSSRNPEELEWETYGCHFLVEATGSFLTTEKADLHKVKKVIISAPPKDKTPTFIYGVNHYQLHEHKIISASSCTTNCLAPFIKVITDNYNIKTCCFTTIHAATSSQYTVDVFKSSARTKRSIFNNIIPHTTGASKSIVDIFPQLDGKIIGNSIRVPVSNCSLLDITLQLKEEDVTLENIKEAIVYSQFYKDIFSINEKNLVSSDFMTTTSPCIIDLKASLSLGKGTFKIMIWYDNEWSYSSQILRLINYLK